MPVPAVTVRSSKEVCIVGYPVALSYSVVLIDTCAR